MSIWDYIRLPRNSDEWRNFGCWITEALRVNVEWHRYLFDLRLGFKREDGWHCYLGFWKPVEQNFWNGIFTLNVYLTKFRIKGCPVVTPRINLVIRPFHDYYFQFGCGILFDRGEFGFKLRFTKVELGDAEGWNEGSV